MAIQETDSETTAFRLSAQQEQLLAAEDRVPILQCEVRLAGPIREGDMRRAFERTIAAHEVLRTTFPRAPGMRDRTQVILETFAPAWGTSEGDETLEAVLARELESALDIERGPLIRGLLVRPDSDSPALVITAHAACADPASLSLLVNEIARMYKGAQAAEDPVQHADYAEWRHELITGDDQEASEGRSFWRRQADDRPAAARILFARRAAASARRARVPVSLDADQVEAISRAATRAGVPLGLFVEACFHALLARLSGVDELLLAGWCDGRSHADLTAAIGPYAQPIPVQTRCDKSTSFAEVLDQVGRARAAGERWQNFATGADLDELVEEATAGFVEVGLQGAASPVLEIRSVQAPADIGLLVAITGGKGGERIDIWYDPAAHDEEDAGELARHLRTLTVGAANRPSATVAELPLVAPAERENLLELASGAPSANDATLPVHHLFERIARATPDAAAIAAAGETRTYGQLNAASNRVAHALRDAGLAPGGCVGLCLERTPGLVEAVLGILKAGGAYVPLNPEHPQARLVHQLTEVGAPILVTEEHLLERFEGFDGVTLCLERDRPRIDSCPDHDPAPLSEPAHPAYVMYTSGSSGLPKGVIVTHANLANYATHMAERLIGEDGDAGRFGVVSAISTDLGNTCVFPPLISGGCIQLISTAAAMDSDAMALELGGTPLDVLKITPSHLQVLLAGERATDVLPRRWLVVGGEAFPWELVEQIRALSPSCRILNHYGPTETTVGCCAFDVREVRHEAATVPIGRPLAGARAYVLGRSGDLNPVGVPGELCIAGAGVTAGYVSEAADKRGAFGPDPFSSGAGRMYRTGDLARYLRDGALEFLGRIDDQVKIRGFRIEPGEIEAALGEHPAIRQAAVVAEPDDRGDPRLVAYLVTTAGPSVEELQEFLATSLPDYMIPTTFAFLEALPFTPSGKIDRRALPALATVQTRRAAEYLAPRDEIEREIAEIWGELLGLADVGVNDDFFALGGHSLLATQAIMRIRRAHGNISLRALLAAPTVAALAEVVRSASTESRTS